MARQNAGNRVPPTGPSDGEELDIRGGYTPDPLYPSQRPPNGNGQAPPGLEPGELDADGEQLLEADREVERLAKRMLLTTVKDWGWPEDPMWAEFPRVARFLLKGSWNGYEPRVPGRISVRVTTTGFACTLTCPSEAQSMEAHASTFTGLLAALEAKIKDHPREWKEIKQGPGAQKLREERKKLRDTRKQDS